MCNLIGDINKLSAPVVAGINAQTGRGLNPEAATYVRLERIYVNDPQKEGRALFPATVMGAEFFGLYIKYHLQMEGQDLKCIDKNDGRQYLKKGDKVTVAIDPADLMIY